MKITIPRFLALSFLAVGSLRADDTATWTKLEEQAQDLATAVQARNVHPIHQIDHAFTDEIVSLRKDDAGLPASQKAKFDALLDDIAKQAHRAHMDGHAAKWDDAATAQKQIGEDIEEAEAILRKPKSAST